MRYGARLLRRNPGFAILTVAVLALGMGATTGIFSVVDALLVRQLPYRDPERIVLLFEAPIANPAAAEGVSPANFLDWKARVETLEFLSAAEPSGYTHTGGHEPQSIPGMRVSGGFFESFGMNALWEGSALFRPVDVCCRPPRWGDSRLESQRLAMFRAAHHPGQR